MQVVKILTNGNTVRRKESKHTKWRKHTMFEMAILVFLITK